MRRKQITAGFWLIAIGVVSVTVLSPSGRTLILGGIPVVTPVAVLLEAIGITMIVTAWSSGWTKKMGIVGAILGTFGMGIALIVDQPFQTEAEYLAVGAGTLFFALLFLAPGRMIDDWKAKGFPAVRFRVVGALIVLVSGAFFSILIAVKNSFRGSLDVVAGSLLFVLLFCVIAIWSGWLLDYIILSGRKFFKSIYRCEIVIWSILAVFTGVLAAIFPEPFQKLFVVLEYGTAGKEVAVLAPLMLFVMLYSLYLFYLFLWKAKKPWNWILLFVAGGYFVAGFSFLAIGDAMRRIAAYLYNGEEPVRFAFGGLTQPEALRAPKPLIRSIVIAILVMAMIVGVLSFLYYIGTTYTPQV
jgi:hypothetical protein